MTTWLGRLCLLSFVFFQDSLALGKLGLEPVYLDWEESMARCQTHHSQTPKTYKEEFKWGMTLAEMEDTFARVYASGGRLPLHADYNPQTDSFQIYFKSTQGLREVPITRAFIENVILQIETALDRGYADYVFFPDMGHSHLYLEASHWQAEYGDYNPVDNTTHLHYAKMLADPRLRPLYHLGEQLQFKDENNEIIDDELLSFKYWHRNFLGTNDRSGRYAIHVVSPRENFNTVSGLEGYHLWSAGFSVQASRSGCFAYRDKEGQKRYFDLSLYDPDYQNADSTANRTLDL